MKPGLRRFAPTGDRFASESPIGFATERVIDFTGKRRALRLGNSAVGDVIRAVTVVRRLNHTLPREIDRELARTVGGSEYGRSGRMLAAAPGAAPESA